MDASEFGLRLILLFFPGVICALTLDTFTVHRPRTQFQFLLNALVLGLLSYFSYWLVLRVSHYMFGVPQEPSTIFLHALQDEQIRISFREVALVCFAGGVLGLLLTTASTHKAHFRLAHRLQLTRKFGELDVWGYTFNSPEISWATVRDHRYDLAYDGWVQVFSDDSQNAELLLREVDVYRNSSGGQLYRVDALYLARERADITIEFRRSDGRTGGGGNA